jgi:hypothetical protein|nr:MAG TPA: hypothetical protein [Caudoviricetes sp.]
MIYELLETYNKKGQALYFINGIRVKEYKYFNLLKLAKNKIRVSSVLKDKTNAFRWKSWKHYRKVEV